MNLVARLLARAAERGDQPAIVEAHRGRDTVTSFSRIAERSARAAAVLETQGIARGDAVLFLAPMGAGLYAWLLGALRLGAVALFLDPSAGRAHVSRCLRRLAPRAFVGSRRAHLLRLVVPEMRRIPVQVCADGRLPFCLSEAHAEGAAATLAACADGDPALVTFTSGSTGEPKAVVRSHGLLLEQHRVLEKALALRAGMADLTTLPIFLLANLASGVTSVIPEGDLARPGAVDARPILGQLARWRPQSCGAAPAFVERLCEACEASGSDLGPLARLHVGGAPVFPDLIARATRLLPRGELVAVYGSSEAEPVAHVGGREIEPDELARMREGGGLLAGRPIEDIECAILPARWGTPLGPFTRARFDATRLGPEAAGEIVVSGRHVVGGYLGGEGDAETKFEVDGRRWHRTGDLGRFDAHGRLWLLGRCSAALATAKGMLYPFAVECAAQQVPGVRRAALARIGGRIVLAYEAQRSVNLRPALAWAAIDEVRRVDRIPLDARHNSKVDYPALARQLSG